MFSFWASHNFHLITAIKAEEAKLKCVYSKYLQNEMECCNGRGLTIDLKKTEPRVAIRSIVVNTRLIIDNKEMRRMKCIQIFWNVDNTNTHTQN